LQVKTPATCSLHQSGVFT